MNTEFREPMDLSVPSVGADKKWPAKRPFLVIETLHRPAANAKTAVKGWSENPANWSSFERPSVVDKVTSKHLLGASVIIDILVANDILGSDGKTDISKALVKNRFTEAPADQLTAHYLNKYRPHIQEAIDLWVIKRNA